MATSRSRSFRRARAWFARLEDVPRVAGTGAFAADHVGETALYCAIVRGTVAHPDRRHQDQGGGPDAWNRGDAHLLHLTLPELPSSPGRDASRRGDRSAGTCPRPGASADKAVAAVVADIPAHAVDTAETIWVEHDELPVVTEVEAVARDQVSPSPTRPDRPVPWREDRRLPSPSNEVDVELGDETGGD